MKQLATMKDGLIDELRTLHETESRLTVSITQNLNLTEVLQVKAEFVVYLSGIRRNLRAIEQIFSLLCERPAVRSMYAMEKSFFTYPSSPSEPTTPDLIALLRAVIQRKVQLYEDARSIAMQLNQQKIALMLRDILHFEHETSIILDEVALADAPSTRVLRSAMGYASPSSHGVPHDDNVFTP